MRLWLFSLVLLLCACDGYKWDGYSLSSSGLYYKIHKLGDGETKPVSGDEVFAAIEVRDANGKVLFNNAMGTGAAFKINLGATDNASFSEAISLMHTGDSASFIFPNSVDVDMLTDGRVQSWEEDYVLNIQLNAIQGELAEVLPPDLEMLELKQLNEFLLANGFNVDQHENGLYIKVLQAGKSAKPISGQQVGIHYLGKFLNGREFDNSRLNGFVLDFQLGKPDQVIQAIDIAIRRIGVGGKVQVVSPSQYAFGAAGSSSGLIPPYTPLVYEIELVSAQ